MSWTRDTKTQGESAYVHSSGVVVRKTGEGLLSRPEWGIFDSTGRSLDEGFGTAKDAKFIAERRYERREWEIQGNYGHGWEMVTTEATRQEAADQLECYEANAPGVPHRMKLVSVDVPPAAVVHTYDRETDACTCGDMWVWHEPYHDHGAGYGCGEAGPFEWATTSSGSSDPELSLRSHPLARAAIERAAAAPVDDYEGHWLPLHQAADRMVSDDEANDALVDRLHDIAGVNVALELRGRR